MLEKSLFLLLVASLPFEGFFIEGALFSFSITNVLLISLFVIIIFRIIITGKAYFVSIPNAFIVFGILLAFQLIEFVSLLATQNLVEDFQRPIMTNVGYLMVTLVTFEVVRNEKDVKSAFVALNFAMIVFVVATTLVVFGVIDQESPLAASRPMLGALIDFEVQRGSLFQISYGSVAMLVSASMSYAILRVLEYEEQWKKWLFFFILGILISILMLDVQSRNVLLAILATVGVIYLFKNGNKSFIIKTAILSLALFVLYMTDAIQALIDVFTIGKDMETVNQRYEQSMSGFYYFSTSPIWGHGTKWMVSSSIMNYANPIHNYFVGIMASNGMLGMMLVLAIWLIMGRNISLLRLKSNLYGMRKWWLVFLSALAGQFVALNFFPGESIKIFYIQIALATILVGAKRLGKEEDGCDRVPRLC